MQVCLCVCCSYRNLANEHETLMQKYLHLLQIVETEKTVAKQLRQQIEDGEIEIERLKSEVTSSAVLKAAPRASLPYEPIQGLNMCCHAPSAAP